MADQKYTPVGFEIWRWFSTPRWRPLGIDSKLLWIFLYTSRAAKTSVPGLWPGSMYGLAESGMLPNEAHNALDRMVTSGLAQYDADNQLVRYALPDTLDRAHTVQALWGWWSKFKTLPAVPLRNAHVPVLWELVNSGKTNQKILDVWKETFGTVVIPTHLPQFLPLSSSDTSTAVQPSLFSTPKHLLNEINDSGPSHHATDLRSGSEIWFLEEGGSHPDRLSSSGRPMLQLVPAADEISTTDSTPGNRLAQDAQDDAARALAERAAEDSKALREALAAAGMPNLLST